MNKTMKKILSFCMSLAMLIGSAVTFTVNAAVSGDFNFKFIFHDVDNNDKVISEKNLTVNGTEGKSVIADFSSIMPTGYVVDGNYTQSTKISVTPYFDGPNVKEVYVKKEVQPTTLNITFETVYGEVVGTKTVSTTATGADGEAWTFMLGTDYELPEGYQLSTEKESVTNIQVPFGSTGGSVVFVEPIKGKEVKTTLYITFETVDGEVVDKIKLSTTATGADGEAWTFMLGTDYELPEGYQLSTEKESVTNIQVPFGSTGGSVVFVEKINKEEPVTPTETVATITFETADGEVVGTTTVSTTAVGGEGEAWTFMLGEDYQLPEGYKLAEGVEQTTNVIIPFGAMGGHTLIVEKINKEEPVTPVDPEEPVNPTDPEKPATDDTKKEETKSDESIKTEVKDDKANTSNKKEEAKAKEDKKSPKTGDNTQVAGYAVTLVACIALIAYYFKKMVASK